MKPRNLTVAAVLIAALAAPVPAAEELTLPVLYKNMAERNYHPAVEGLKSAKADVTCGIFDTVVAAFPAVDKTAINVRYEWSRPSLDVPPQNRFIVSGIPEDQADLANRGKLIFQNGQAELVIGTTIYGSIESTNATAVSDGGVITVSGQAKNPSSQVKELTVIINEGDYKIEKMVMDLGGSEATIDWTSTDLGGKWGASSSVLTSPQGKRVVNYEYTQVDGVYVPSKISIEYQGLDGAAKDPPFVYEFSNWSIERLAEPGAAQSEES